MIVVSAPSVGLLLDDTCFRHVHSPDKNAVFTIARNFTIHNAIALTFHNDAVVSMCNGTRADEQVVISLDSDSGPVV